MAKKISKSGNPYAILQCTSKYPTLVKDIGLNVLEEFINKTIDEKEKEFIDDLAVLLAGYAAEKEIFKEIWC